MEKYRLQNIETNERQATKNIVKLDVSDDGGTFTLF